VAHSNFFSNPFGATWVVSLVSNLPAQHVGWRMPVMTFRPVKWTTSAWAPQISQVGGAAAGGGEGGEDDATPGGVEGGDGGGGDGKSSTQHAAADAKRYCPALLSTLHSSLAAVKLYSLSRAAAQVYKVPSE
jgi:hypothetical protein